MNINGLSYDLGYLSSVEDLRLRWTDLESRSDCSFFLTWDWISTWVAVTPDLRPLLLTVQDGAIVVGLALLQPTIVHRNLFSRRALFLHQTGHRTTDATTIEYNGILCDRHYAPLIGRSVFQFLATRPETTWDEIHVALATNHIARYAADAGLINTQLARTQTWVVNLDEVRSSGKSYLDTIGSSTRYQIRRAFKLYERRGPITAVTAQTQREAVAFFEELKLHHQLTWTKRGKAGSFAEAYFEDFHRVLIGKCIDRGTVELLRVCAGERLIGVLYNFVHRQHVYAYQTGFFYEPDPKLKPGLISHYVCLNRHLQAGALVYDFLAGGSRYKANLGVPGPELVHHVFQRPTIRARSEFFLRGLKERIIKPSRIGRGRLRQTL